MAPVPRTVEELEDRLSQPDDRVLAAFRSLPGDVLILGAAGKMGPSLARMARRAADATGSGRRVMAVSRFSSEATVASLRDAGVEVVRADLSEPGVWSGLPDAPLVVFMAGQKFGTTDTPGLTWYTNTVVPALAASRYRHSAVVAFSTGNVYPLVSVTGPGSRETDAPGPVGEYAMSCLGRERVFAHAASAWGTRSCLLRLNYAVDLRYGVLVDIAQRVLAGRPVDVTMGWFNCIWQRDANAVALSALAHASAPPLVVNLTGPERLSVREVAEQIATHAGRSTRHTGTEATDALLSDTTRMQSLFGMPSVPADELLRHVVEWLQGGGPTLSKPTHFEQRRGAF